MDIVDTNEDLREWHALADEQRSGKGIVSLSMADGDLVDGILTDPLLASDLLDGSPPRW